MHRFLLLLLSGALLSAFQGGSAIRDSILEIPPNYPTTSQKGKPQTPFIDELPEDISKLNIRPSLTHDRPIKPVVDERSERQFTWPFIPFANPIESYNLVPLDIFNVLATEMKVNLGVILKRQKLLLKYVECSCPNVNKCKKVPEARELDLDNLKHNQFWNWGFPNPTPPEYVTYEALSNVANSFNEAIAALTQRQYLIFEYTKCSCPDTTECTVIPVDEIQNNFSPAKIPPGSSFLQTLAALFAHIPFVSWFNFNPPSSIFPGFNPPLIPPINNFPTITPPINNFPPLIPQNTPNIWSSIVGANPIAGGGSFSTSSKPYSSQTSSSFISTGSGKPSSSTHEEYTIQNLGGGATHVSSSSDGSNFAVVSTSGDLGKPSSPTHEEYTFQNPGGGTTHVSSTSDGNSIAVSSTSGNFAPIRQARQAVFGNLDDRMARQFITPGQIVNNVVEQVAAVGQTTSQGILEISNKVGEHVSAGLSGLTNHS